jgi:prephenate dehydratase
MRMHVKVLGPSGTFGHEVSILSAEWLREQFGDFRVDFVEDNAAILKAAAYNKCVGIVPLWNPDAGLVKGVTDFLLRQHKGFKSSIIGVRKLRVRHQLLVHRSVKRRGQIREVMSHPHALGQCDKVLSAMNLWTRRRTTSTAKAAQLVAHDKRFRTTAAIASQLAADTYRADLKVWKHDIEDSPDNFTRFYIWGPHPTRPTGQDRTALIFRTENKPGRLWRELEPIRAEHTNLSTIRQISADDASESAFYCEFDGHRYSDSGRRILREMNKAGHVMVLGSWPIA